MKAMFDPVIAMITTLLQSQLDAERRQSGFVTIKASTASSNLLPYANL